MTELVDVEVAPDGVRRRLALGRSSVVDDAEGNRCGGSGQTIDGGAGAARETLGGRAQLVGGVAGPEDDQRQLASLRSSRWVEQRFEWSLAAGGLRSGLGSRAMIVHEDCNRA
jgi:hypothetical protein